EADAAAGDAAAIGALGVHGDVAEPELRNKIVQPLARQTEIEQCAERHVAADARKGIEQQRACAARIIHCRCPCSSLCRLSAPAAGARGPCPARAGSRRGTVRAPHPLTRVAAAYRVPAPSHVRYGRSPSRSPSACPASSLSQPRATR